MDGPQVSPECAGERPLKQEDKESVQGEVHNEPPCLHNMITISHIT